MSKRASQTAKEGIACRLIVRSDAAHPSSSLTVPSSGAAHPPAATGNHPLGRRIKNVRGEQFSVLIPTTCLAPLPHEAVQTKLAPFGAVYADADSAAEAADRALIAMWGPEAATQYLNNPIQNYGPGAVQLYGTYLTSYLVSLCEEGSQSMKAKKSEALRRRKAMQSETVKRRKIRHVQIVEGIVDGREPCGMCPACKLPFLGENCYRTSLARRVRYSAYKAAEELLNKAPSDAYSAEPVEVLAADTQQASGGLESDRGQNIELLTSDDMATQSKKKACIDAKKDLIWHAEPPTGAAQVRKAFGDQLAALGKKAEAVVESENLAMVSAHLQAFEASAPRGLAVAPTPWDAISSMGPHKELIEHAAEAQLLGADVALLNEDDPRFQAPLGPSPGLQQCFWCRGWHHEGQRTFECPVLQGAYATRRPPPMCSLCVNVAGRGGCTACRGELPEGVWTPPVLPAPWLDRVAPATREVMHCVQRLGSAAAIDFDRPDVAAAFGPTTLLAIGLLAEELAGAQLRAFGLS